MDAALLEEMKQYVGFGTADERNLKSLAPMATPLISAVVQRFYDELMRHDSARAVFVGGLAQIERLKVQLAGWMKELFEGPYDLKYVEKRLQVGVTHVRVQLPQRYMFLGMELIRHELTTRLLAAGGAEVAPLLDSLNRLLMLDLAIMLESYVRSHLDRVRQLERATMEDRLDRAEKLAELGQLAASLAHEIKNPLAGISGAIQVIGDHMPDNDPHRPIVVEILRQIDRLDSTVKDLLQYARPRPLHLREVSLGAVVNRVMTLVREEPAISGRRLAFRAPDHDVNIVADDGQIEQVVLNLVLNAAHASRNGQAISLHIDEGADRVRLRVEDQGKGMTADVLARALEPFFTTKARGTGLGLSICRRIVEEHGGELHLHSEAGRGTTAVVELPRGGPERIRGQHERTHSHH
ncbi:MAG: Globin-coupled histidine kinase [Phycisphaerae bacterium]|nr:Globin-coupled histidine kinase [Phycisphaerae bacterium]